MRKRASENRPKRRHGCPSFTRKSKPAAEWFQSPEPKYYAGANVVVVLAGLSRVHVHGRHAAPVIARFESELQIMQFGRERHIESDAAMHYAGCLYAMASVWSEEHQVLARREISNSTAETDPWRNEKIPRKAHAQSRSGKKRAVLIGNNVQTVV